MRKAPNIIYILADDMGYGDISCLNANSKLRTLNIDRLAEEGIRFTDAHSSSSVCTPSRYSILTGCYNWRSNLKQGVLFGYDRPLIEDGRMTVASFLKQNGYNTACIGKWHLGLEWAKHGNELEDIDFSKPISGGPLSRGFDRFFGISASLDMPPYVYISDDLPTAIPDRIDEGRKGKSFWREGPIAPDFRHSEVLTRLADEAVKYIEKHAIKNDPFFLYFPLSAPHTPILPDKEFVGKSGTNEYGDFCLMVDDIVGKVMAATERMKISNDTIIIFTADNGCSPEANFAELAESGHHPSYVFRGHKADIYEGGHRIPYIMRWPAEIQSGRICDHTICLVDLMATCADLLEIPLPDDTGEDSISNLPLWFRENKNPIREATVHHSINGSFSIRKGRWKLDLCPGSGGWSEPRPGEELADAPPAQLYDLESDIGEQRNLYYEYPEIVNMLTELLTAYMRDGRSAAYVRGTHTE